MENTCVIRRLSPDVIKKIAAGEIIVRPSSALKELIENSIDAGATEIKVNLSCNPLDFCEITDNGSGVCREDLKIICKRFTTSKTKDSIANVKSLGFRGEALSSLSQNAHVTISSRTENEEKRTVLRYVECEPLLDEIEYEAGPRGFYLKYENLFYNYETRQKSLSSSVNFEFNTCLQLVQKYSIHFPHINFIFNKVNNNVLQLNTTSGITSQTNPTTLEFKSKSNIITSTSGSDTKNENKEVSEEPRVDYDHHFFSKIYPELTVKPSLSDSVKEYIDNVYENSMNNLKDVKTSIKNVYGLNIGNNLFEFVFNNFDYLFFNCKGLVSHPNQASKIDNFVLFINNRLIELPSLRNLVYTSFSDITNNKYRRFIYLSLFVPYDKIDANIHPSKKKIFLEEQSEILQYIGNKLTHKLIEIMRVTTPSALNENTNKLVQDYKFYKGKFSDKFKPRNNYKQMDISHFVTPLFLSQSGGTPSSSIIIDDNDDRGEYRNISSDDRNDNYIINVKRGRYQVDSDDYSPFTSLCNPFGHIPKCPEDMFKEDTIEEVKEEKDIKRIKEDTDNSNNKENKDNKEDIENKTEEKQETNKEKEENKNQEHSSKSEHIPSFNINNYITQTTTTIDPESDHYDKEDTIYNSDSELVDKDVEYKDVVEFDDYEIDEYLDDKDNENNSNKDKDKSSSSKENNKEKDNIKDKQEKEETQDEDDKNNTLTKLLIESREKMKKDRNSALNYYVKREQNTLEMYDHNRMLERINKINAFYYNKINETSRLGRIYDVHEIKLLINNMNFHKDNDLSKLVLNSSYVGIIDKTYVLVQHKNNLVMMNVLLVSRECCHQSIIWRLNNLPSFRLSNSISLSKILLHSINKYDIDKKVEDLINYNIIKVLNALFGFRIKDLIVYKLPNILNGYFPGPEYIPDLFYNIFTINYNSLTDLIVKTSNMLAYYYTLPPMSVHLKKEVDTNYENFASRVLLSSCQKFQDLCIPKRFNSNGTFIKLANISLLYKIFERC